MLILRQLWKSRQETQAVLSFGDLGHHGNVSIIILIPHRLWLSSNISVLKSILGQQFNEAPKHLYYVAEGCGITVSPFLSS